MLLFTEGRLLWRNRLFRQALVVRLITQSADGTLQMGLATYVLLSPVSQPDALSIASVLAVTLLPFSIVGPMIGVVLDRWDRRRVIMATDVVRCGLGLLLAALVVSGPLSPPEHATLLGAALVATSLNRFLMANLQAALPRVVTGTDYLVANSIVPMVGPIGLAVGAIVAGTVRLASSGRIPTHWADGMIFATSALLFATSATLASLLPARSLGPDETRRPRLLEVLDGLRRALVHLGERPTAAAGLVALAVQRICYGMVFVCAILVMRNWFNGPDNISGATRDIALWAAANGAGVLASPFLTSQFAGRTGLRRWIVALFVVGGVIQIFPGSTFVMPGMLVASFVIGVQTQSMKISVDTLVHHHVDAAFKGRIFTLYDAIFNATVVLAAVLAAALAPPTGHSDALFVGIGLTMILSGIGVSVLGRAPVPVTSRR